MSYSSLSLRSSLSRQRVKCLTRTKMADFMLCALGKQSLALVGVPRGLGLGNMRFLGADML